MTHSILSRIAGAACALALAASALVFAGCAQQSSTANDQSSASRQYMTQVNQKMDDLTDRLSGFSDAVARGDIVTMRTQADNAFKAIDELSAIEAPDALKDVQESYVEGCSSLRDALSAYIDLYSEIDGSSNSSSFDYSTYADRLSAIQDQYNQGIDKLKEADTAASEK